MAAPETPIAPGPCPTDEEIAAFLDGTLTAKERAQVVAHLATCKSCYEIFAGAAEFALEAGETAAPPDPGTVIPFPGGRRPAVSRPRLWWLGAAAAAVVALGIGIPVYRSLSTPPICGTSSTYPRCAEGLKRKRACCPVPPRS